MSKIKIQNVQAIKYVEFSMPEGSGGVRLLRGSMGAGKSTVLTCINALLGRKATLTAADGAQSGLIEGLGVSIKVGSKQTAKGNVDVPSLEGRFDFSDLVEPAIKDPVARNKSRVRALVGLTGCTGQPEDFYDLFGGKDGFWQIVARDGMPKGGDILDLADYIKSQAEAQARMSEARFESDNSAWQVAVMDSKGHSVNDIPAPVKELADAFSNAQRERLAAEEAHRTNEAKRLRNAEIQSKIAAHQSSKPERDIESLQKMLSTAKQTVADLEAKLATAKQTLEQVRGMFQKAMEWEERLTELEGMIQPEADELPEIEPLALAEQEAMTRLESAEETKRRYDAAVRAKQLSESVLHNEAEAKRLREIAAKCNEVVTSKLPKGCPLQLREVGEGKSKKSLLCYFHDKREQWIPIDELSTGEKWQAILPIAIQAVGEGGVLPATQEAWQALDPAGKEWVAATCKVEKVWLISAEVTSGELHVEEFA